MLSYIDGYEKASPYGLMRNFSNNSILYVYKKPTRKEKEDVKNIIKEPILI